MTICMPEACNEMPLMEDTKSVLFLGFKFAGRCNEESAEKPKRSCLVTKTDRNEEEISVSKNEASQLSIPAINVKQSLNQIYGFENQDSRNQAFHMKICRLLQSVSSPYFFFSSRTEPGGQPRSTRSIQPRLTVRGSRRRSITDSCQPPSLPLSLIHPSFSSLYHRALSPA